MIKIKTNKKRILFILLVVVSIFVTGCGSKEKTSTNMSIDEDSIINDKDHPPISNKKLFNSFNINRVSSILSKNIIKIHINE